MAALEISPIKIGYVIVKAREVRRQGCRLG